MPAGHVRMRESKETAQLFTELETFMNENMSRLGNAKNRASFESMTTELQSRNLLKTHAAKLDEWIAFASKPPEERRAILKQIKAKQARQAKAEATRKAKQNLNKIVIKYAGVRGWAKTVDVHKFVRTLVDALYEQADDKWEHVYGGIHATFFHSQDTVCDALKALYGIWRNIDVLDIDLFAAIKAAMEHKVGHAITADYSLTNQDVFLWKLTLGVIKNSLDKSRMA